MSAKKKTNKDTRTRKELLEIIKIGNEQYRKHCEEIADLKSDLGEATTYSGDMHVRALDAEKNLKSAVKKIMLLSMSLTNAKRIIRKLSDAALDYIVMPTKNAGQIEEHAIMKTTIKDD